MAGSIMSPVGSIVAKFFAGLAMIVPLFATVETDRLNNLIRKKGPRKSGPELLLVKPLLFAFCRLFDQAIRMHAAP
jgi:hypothetical protein